MSAAGDWEAIFKIHGAALLLFARQFGAGRADAEDIMQEAFVRCWRSRDRAEDVVAYMFGCVKRCALEWQRASYRRARRELARASLPHAQDLFAPNPETDDWLPAIEAALGELPDEQRQVLVMKIWGGLSFPQIAGALDLSPNTAASRFRYGLEKLRQRLAREQPL